ncbi:MAG TPA: hypothetical protein VG796_05150 [Verrucomicrobiales bacterium]|jgi:hypothetical protein|nr:hypothetical protein [Verrucomicrobiales bacterium]
MKRHTLPLCWCASVILTFAGGYLSGNEASPATKPSKPSKPALDGAPDKAGESALITRMRNALATPDPAARLSAWLYCLDHAAPEDLAAAEAVLEAAGGAEAHGWEWILFWRRWGNRDSLAALEFLEKNPALQRFSTASEVGYGWGNRDPKAAMQWVNSQAAPSLASEMVPGVMKGWTELNAEEATAFLLASKPESPARDSGVSWEMLRTIWQKEGAPATTRWFETIQKIHATDPGFVTSSFRTLQDMYVRSADVPFPGEFLGTQQGKPWWDDEPVDRLLRNTCWKSPERLLDAVAAMGPHPDTGKYFQLEYYIQLRNDEEGTGRWLKSHTDFPAYDQAAAAMARSRASVDAAAAAEWANTIKDEALRRKVRAQVQSGETGSGEISIPGLN